MTGPSRRRSLAFEAWPEPDRAMWARLVRDDGLFGEAGAFAALRPPSTERYRRDYGYWLAHLLDAVEPGPVDGVPHERATPERVRTWIDSMAGLAPRTVALRVESLVRVLEVGTPGADLGVLRRAAARLRRRADEAERVRQAPEAPAATRLMDVGRALLRRAEDDDLPVRARRTMTRDAALVMTMARHPLRRGEMAALELGRSYLIQGDRHLVDLDADDAKTGRPARFEVDAEVATAIAPYLERGRPLFPGRIDPQRGPLWLSDQGGALTPNALGLRVAGAVERATGVRVTPRRFRHVAATAMARASLPDPRLAAKLLGHRDDRITDRHYNDATAAEAISGYGRLLTDLSRRGGRS